VERDGEDIFEFDDRVITFNIFLLLLFSERLIYSSATIRSAS